MRIAIFGAGAVGSHLGARLAQAGHRVVLVARGQQLAAIRSGGVALEIDGAIERIAIEGGDDPSVLGVQDIVFVAVKATALAASVEPLMRLIDRRTTVVFLQNGMTWWYPIGLPAGHRSIPALPIFDLGRRMTHLEPRQLVAAVVYSANELIAPGHVRNNSPGNNALVISAPHPDGRSQADAVRALVAATPFRTPVPVDARHALWLKLIGNAAASAIAVASGNASGVALDEALATTFVRMVDDGIAVADAYGFELRDRIDVGRWTRRKGEHKPSLLQDLEAGRPMEVDEMIVAPAAFARHAGVFTPTLDAVNAIAVRRAIDRGLFAPPHEPQA